MRAVLLVAAVVVSACGAAGPDRDSATSAGFPSSLVPVIAAASESATLPVRSPEATATQSQVPAPCLVMALNFCAKGERALASIGGQTYLYIGFKLDRSLRIAISAPGDGWFQDGRCTTSQVSELQFRTRTQGWQFEGRVSPANRLQRPVKAGELIGYVEPGDGPVIGPYDLVFSVFSSGHVVEEHLTQVFPEASSEQVATALFEPPSCVTPLYGDSPTDYPWSRFPDLP